VTILLMLLGLAILVFANVPIAVALGAIAVVAIVLTQGTYMLPNVALTMYEGAQPGDENQGKLSRGALCLRQSVT
jgi:C4-dicarboxylate transporter, DctM subunit